MKNLNNYIFEKLVINKNTSIIYHYQPKDKNELRKILEERLAEDKNANLNDIDVTKITDMGIIDGKRGLFEGLDPHNIDISDWDVSNVKDMCYMFMKCSNFNSDLSRWDVSQVEDMNYMFMKCSNFNSDLSRWNVLKVEKMKFTFAKCLKFNSDLSSWDVSNVKDMYCMFYKCTNFNADLSSWDVSNIKNMDDMFAGCQSLKNKPSWYKE